MADNKKRGFLDFLSEGWDFDPTTGWKEGWWDPLRKLGGGLYDLDVSIFGEPEARRAARSIREITSDFEREPQEVPIGGGISRVRVPSLGLAPPAAKQIAPEAIVDLAEQIVPEAQPMLPHPSLYIKRAYGREYWPERAVPLPSAPGRQRFPERPVKPTPKVKTKDISKGSSEKKILEKVKTPLREETPPELLPTPGEPIWHISQLKGPEEKKSFWLDLLKKMFIPGTTPTGIPWILPTLAMAAGTPESARFLNVWMGLRQGMAAKEEAKRTAKQNAYNQTMYNLRMGYTDDLTPEQRKHYSDIDPTLLDKKQYTKYQRYFWNGKKWISEDVAIAQGADTASMPMSGQEEKYIDWAVRAKTPLAKAEETATVERTLRIREIPKIKASLRARGVDPNSPEVQAKFGEYLRTGAWEGAKWVEADGFYVQFDPVAGVVNRKVKIGISTEDRARIEKKNRIEIEKELQKYRLELRKLPENAQELYIGFSRHLNDVYEARVQETVRQMEYYRRISGDIMAMRQAGYSPEQIREELMSLERRRQDLDRERNNVLGQLHGEMTKQGYQVLWNVWKRTEPEKRVSKEKETYGTLSERFGEVGSR